MYVCMYTQFGAVKPDPTKKLREKLEGPSKFWGGPDPRPSPVVALMNLHSRLQYINDEMVSADSFAVFTVFTIFRGKMMFATWFGCHQSIVSVRLCNNGNFFLSQKHKNTEFVLIWSP